MLDVVGQAAEADFVEAPEVLGAAGFESDDDEEDVVVDGEEDEVDGVDDDEGALEDERESVR
ncbi:hypothetical protein ABZS66_33830 [Dactylosporangium sp. NPDC005572]|uniref:hypothetical protein n=1 Tax=Dactylosporangium sp. NPDC005572 TaxID=3156889 RepID=UPI0033A7B1FD